MFQIENQLYLQNKLSLKLFNIINDNIDIALLVDADGVHVGQDDLPPSEVRKLIGDDKIIGLTTHSPEQGKKAV